MAMRGWREVQLDGLPGPTQHFGGLSPGNLASEQHAGWVSHPRQAALQCLEKMRAVLRLGMPQGLLPPLPRPDCAFLRRLGFAGEDAAVLASAAASAPEQLSAACSSAAMWSANAATVIPSCDTPDGRCHLLPANLLATPHRALEAAPRTRDLGRLIARDRRFALHEPLPATPALADEGAANHSRLCADGRVLHCFVYGRAPDVDAAELPRRHPARQTRAAQAACARLAGLDEERVLFVRQHPAAIDAGAFHNDVLMVGDAQRVLIHERAWVDQADALAEIRRRLPAIEIVEIAEAELDLPSAVRSYLFNSQLLRTPQGVVLVAPAESADGAPARIVQRLIDDGFIDRVCFQELRESMFGGGGPACLRLRLWLSEGERAALAAGLLLDEERIDALVDWVRAHYREELRPTELADPQLLREARAASQALRGVLGQDAGQTDEQQSP